MLKNKLKILILLGLIFSNFTVKYHWPIISLIYIVYGIAGLSFLKFKKFKKKIFKILEWGFFFIAIMAAIQMNLAFEANYFIFVSISLVIYQLGRLFYSISDREAKYSLAIAIFHIGLSASKITEPIGFLLMLMLSVYFIPKAVYQMEANHFLDEKQKKCSRIPLPGNKKRTVVLIVLMVFFFLCLPRFKLLDDSNNAEGMGKGGIALTKTMDMSSPLAGDYFRNRLLFKVYAQDVGYLKIDSLYKFDGDLWLQTKDSFKADASRSQALVYDPSLLYRKVRILSQNGIGLSLPTDFYPMGVSLAFKHPIYIARHGALLAKPPLPANFIYRYWSKQKPEVITPLSAEDSEELTDLASYEPSLRLTHWLNSIIDSSESDLRNAGKLVEFFRNNFIYNLKSPSLNREDPMDDFMFNQRQGHCERYASALAILLRMQDIPARVTRGFVPKQYNPVGKYYNIFSKDAHAWVEAWFPDEGWVKLDPTPPEYGFPSKSRNYALSFYEYARDIWEVQIVNFNVDSQKRLVFTSKYVFTRLANISFQNSHFIGFGLIFSFIGFLLFKINWSFFSSGFLRQKKATSIIKANHFYGKLLKILAKDDHKKWPNQTPLEFLTVLKNKKHPAIIHIKYITDQFCDIRYGKKSLSEELEKNIGKILRVIGRISNKRVDSAKIK